MLTGLLQLLLLPPLCSAMVENSVSNRSAHYPMPIGNWSGHHHGNDHGETYPGPTDEHFIPGPNPGLPGSDYCDLLMQAEVPPPVSQVPWFCICSQCKNGEGPKGDRGDRGLPGPQGSPGTRGPTGFRGRPGFSGSEGLKGQKGDDGGKGQQGSIGFSGPKGARGFKGEKGDHGVEGQQGVEGPQGEKGTCPESCDNVQGPPGPPGLPGSSGPKGLQGVSGSMGDKGDKGDKGDPGIRGVPGQDGKKGDEGEKGLCDCVDGSDGAKGEQGPPGPKGDKGDTGMKGDQGVRGEKGLQGVMGMMGLRGPCSRAIQSAFSACLSQSFPEPNFPIPFAEVITNQQRHFNPSMGIYTAPVNGTYVFSFHVAVYGKVVKIGLFHNFHPMAKVTETTSQATASHQVVLHLKMGDMVWLQVKDTTSNGMINDYESKSTFSGYLLHPDSCEVPIVRDFNDYKPTATPTYAWGPDTTTPAA